MNQLRATVRVDPDHIITGVAPQDVPPGVHEVTIEVTGWPAKRYSVADLPKHDLPWDDTISLRREDIYLAETRYLRT